MSTSGDQPRCSRRATALIDQTSGGLPGAVGNLAVLPLGTLFAANKVVADESFVRAVAPGVTTE